MSGSVGDVALTVTELTCGLAVVLAGTVYVIVRVAEAPFARAPIVHVKFGPAPTLAQPAGRAPRVNPVGQVSVNETPAAAAGPLFVTVIV